jgi:hypothetical protein
MKLHNLINPKLGLEIKDNRVTLSEKQTEENALKEVTICQISENVFFFKMDQEIVRVCKNENNCVGNYTMEQCQNCFLNDENEKINKRCDCIIFYYKNSELYLFCCELKSKGLEPIQYETQLINTKLFVDYLFILFKKFYNDENIKIKQVTYILFYLLREKRPIQRNKQGKNPKHRKNNRFERSGNVKEYRLKPKREPMKNYPEEKIIKHPFEKPIYNYIEWKDLVNSFNLNYNE